MCLASTKSVIFNAGENVANMLQKNWFTGAVGNICHLFSMKHGARLAPLVE
jgi:hypothetical protein